jgi:hypothetical protein
VQAVIHPCLLSSRLINWPHIQGCSVYVWHFLSNTPNFFKQNNLIGLYKKILPFIEWNCRLLTYPGLLFLALHQDQFTTLSIARKLFNTKCIVFFRKSRFPLAIVWMATEAPGTDSATLFCFGSDRLIKRPTRVVFTGLPNLNKLSTARLPYFSSVWSRLYGVL